MNIQLFRSDLLLWYKEHQRDLPWRKTNNPYYIWISEIMLQQTQVATVIPYYLHFIDVFPTIASLATGNIEDVYKCWEGLGYYSRARNLQEAAKMIMDNHQGIFPNTYEEILSLKGIGPYTASAISSIAFHYPKGVVDGNVLRILSRIYNIDSNIALNKTKNEFQILCDSLVDPNDPSSFNQALMDLGATICKPKHPQCSLCPIKKHCLAYSKNKQNVLPVNIKKTNKKELSLITCLISYDDAYFLVKNKGGLLDGLYGFVQYEVESPRSFEEEFYKQYQHSIEVVEYIKDVKHVFSHRTWNMSVYKARFLNQPALPLNSLMQLEALPMATAHKKLLKLI